MLEFFLDFRRNKFTVYTKSTENEIASEQTSKKHAESESNGNIPTTPKKTVELFSVIRLQLVALRTLLCTRITLVQKCDALSTNNFTHTHMMAI